MRTTADDSAWGTLPSLFVWFLLPRPLFLYFFLFTVVFGGILFVVLSLYGKKEDAKKLENSFALFEKNRYICSVHAESVRGTTYGKKLVEALCFILVLET